jgi:hypothetical protein
MIVGEVGENLKLKAIMGICKARDFKKEIDEFIKNNPEMD